MRNLEPVQLSDYAIEFLRLGHICTTSPSCYYLSLENDHVIIWRENPDSKENELIIEHSFPQDDLVIYENAEFMMDFLGNTLTDWGIDQDWLEHEEFDQWVVKITPKHDRWEMHVYNHLDEQVTVNPLELQTSDFC